MKDYRLEERHRLIRCLIIMGIAFIGLLVAFQYMPYRLEMPKVFTSLALSMSLFIVMNLNDLFHNGFLGYVFLIVFAILIFKVLSIHTSEIVLLITMVLSLILLIKQVIDMSK